MNLKQTTATILTTGGALAAWLAGGVTTHPPATSAPVVQQSPVDVKSAELATELGRLHERLRPTAAPRQPGRNLFRFHARPAPAAPAVLPPPVVEAPPAPAPVVTPMRLVGMAEDPGADGPVRVAFISADGQLFNVKEGETVLGQYRVTKITPDVVELADVNDGTIRRLALR